MNSHTKYNLMVKCLLQKKRAKEEVEALLPPPELQNLKRSDQLHAPNYNSITNNESFLSSEEEEEEEEIFNLNDESGLIEKIRMIITCSVPITFTFLLAVFGSSIMMFFAGQLSKKTSQKEIFAGVSLALTYCNISFLSLMEGFSSAVETLSSNHNGAKNYQAVGQTFHKSLISLTLVSVPLLTTWYFAEELFLAMGVDETLASIAQRFLMARMLAAPVEIAMMSYMKYLQSMGLMHPGMYAGMCYNVLLVVLCSLCVHYFEFSYQSLAYCHVLSTSIELIFIVLITHHKKEVQRTMAWPTLASVWSVKDFLVFGFAGCVMMCAEWWAFELLTVLAAMVSPEALSAQSIVLQAITIVFMFPLGIGISTGSIVGNALGAKYKHLAISIGKLSMGVIFVLDLFLCPAILYFRYDFVELFTSDPVVVYMCAEQCLPIMAFAVFVDGLQAVTSGVLRGAGRQNLGATVNIAAYYLIALPIAWYLCFRRDLQVMGVDDRCLCGNDISDVDSSGFHFVEIGLCVPRSGIA